MFASRSQSANVLDLRDLVEGSLDSQNSSDFELSNPLSTQSGSVASSHEVLSPLTPPRREHISQSSSMSTSFRFPTRQVTMAKKKLAEANTAPNESTAEELSQTIQKIEGILNKCKSQVDVFENSAVLHQRQQKSSNPSPPPKRQKTVLTEKKRKREESPPSPVLPEPSLERRENKPEIYQRPSKTRKQTRSPTPPPEPDGQRKQLEQLSKDIAQMKDQLNQLSNFFHHQILFELTEIRRAFGRQGEPPPRYVVPWECMAPMGYPTQILSQRSQRVRGVSEILECSNQSGDDLLLFEEASQ